MDDLIARLEAAPEGSRELDVEIWDEVAAWPVGVDPAWRHAPNGADVHALTFAPDYTKSVDIALTLLPEKLWLMIEWAGMSREWPIIRFGPPHGA